METVKSQILSNICYTEMVYDRINKKLKTGLSRIEIEHFIYKTLHETSEDNFIKRGKNIYVTSVERGIVITINSHTFRIITASPFNGKHQDLPLLP